ncbi:MAG: hypothetical protein U0531_05420 [Dehalococcoidia bacterium]
MSDSQVLRRLRTPLRALAAAIFAGTVVELLLAGHRRLGAVDSSRSARRRWSRTARGGALGPAPSSHCGS